MLELVGELVGRLAAPLQLLVQHLVLTDHLTEVVGRRGELRLLGERFGAQSLLLHGRRLLLPPEGSAVGVGGGEKLGLRRRLLLRRRQT